MQAAQLKSLVESYFAAVDRKDLAATLAFFAPEASFTIATYGLVYRGRDIEIRAMFERLFARYASVRHSEFHHVVGPPQRIASRFQVLNTAHDGSRYRKSNCNFFRVRDQLMDEVLVYMSGDNSLT